MTEKTLEWLNANRFRAYPFVNDAGLISGRRRIPDCLLLDCLVVDTRHDDKRRELTFIRLEVTADSTSVYMRYGSDQFKHTFSGGETSGPGSIVVLKTPEAIQNPLLHMRIVLSSHAYILDKVGPGAWDFNGKVLPTKVISVSASGVSGIKVNGSEGTFDRGFADTLTGDIILKDGYRTMPTVSDGKIIVNVGRKYGEDPCRHDWGDLPVEEECSSKLLFFCGQRANGDGDVVLKGGPGVSVTTGRNYVHRHSPVIDTYGEVGISPGESIPCIEVTATSELIKIYTPTPEE